MNLLKIASFALAVGLTGLVLSADVQAKVYGKKIEKNTTACQPEGDIHEIVEKGNPTQDAKCFVTCIMTKWGLLSEDGGFQPDGVRKVTKAIREFDRNPAEYKDIDEVIITKCGAIEEPEKCNKRYAIAECGFKVFTEIQG
ncbi:uncharacterized protein LOC119655411 isoform X2 [Hermetia illucens]|uniref:uncharacterized protein LOC119655411 isoform X2 n=1 Tax=Hermetia illucens TaxID=343691 RepID=UPI0018CC6C11|nr:uncharacterized protein LOC119655411 isoform X2 [Hermetia illucens]